jgi:hypothetical protein
MQRTIALLALLAGCGRAPFVRPLTDAGPVEDDAGEVLEAPDAAEDEITTGVPLEVVSGAFAGISLADRGRPVHLGGDGRLRNVPDEDGDVVPDFSHAGYRGGGVALPRPAGPIVEVRPGAGDDLDRIQAAIDAVAAMPVGSDGIRGVVLLRAGTYQVRGGEPGRGRTDRSHVVIDEGGIVLRGEGTGRDGGTVLRATSLQPMDGQRVVIEIGRESAGPTAIEGTRRQMRGDRLPVGARVVPLEDVSPFSPGDTVMVTHPQTAEWIDRVGMDACSDRGSSLDTSDRAGETCMPGGSHWRPTRDQAYDRVVVSVDAAARTITLDAPLPQAFERRFGGGDVERYRFHARIAEVGVEHLRGVSEFDASRPDAHAWNLVLVHDVENAWVRDVVAEHFAHSTVRIVNGAKWITVEDSAYVDPVSRIEGGHRYPFQIDGGQLVLVQRCRAEGGRHSFVFGDLERGPNVFLDCEANGSWTSSETHNRWATGSLYDNVVDRPRDAAAGSPVGIHMRNEGATDSGHGWSGANGVVWNSRAPVIHVESPPTAANWAFGCRTARARGDARWFSIGTAVDPRSLYLAQLRDRLGDAAVAAIGD